RQPSPCVEVDEDHLGALQERPARLEDGVRDLLLVACSGYAHLQQVQGLEAAPLRLRGLEMLRGGEREAHVRADVFEEPYVPLAERVRTIGLERKQGRSFRTTPDWHPDDR